MKSFTVFKKLAGIAGIAGLVSLLAGAAFAVEEVAPGQPYSGDAASGENVVALWQFPPDGPALESSGKPFRLEIRGRDTRFTDEGRFGGALEITHEREPGREAGQGAMLAHQPELSPPGAFTLEMWIQPGDLFPAGPVSVLLDKKYLFGTDSRPGMNRDYLLMLRAAGREHRFYLEAELGFGDETESIRSEAISLDPGNWAHVAFTYNGAGECLFYLNGEKVGEKHLEGREGVHPGTRGLVIGDRAGSLFSRFVGKISEVRICSEAVAFVPLQSVALDLEHSRTAFYKKEEGAALEVEVKNRRTTPAAIGKLRVTGATGDREIPIGTLEGGETRTLKVPLDTSLKPGSYRLDLELLGERETLLSEQTSLDVKILPRPRPDELPVIMWGHARGRNVERLKELGFTHFIGLWQGAASPVPAFLNPREVQSVRDDIDKALSVGMRSVGRISIGHARKYVENHQREGRNGEGLKSLNTALPEVQETAKELGRFVGREFGDMPSLEGILVDTEVRDHTRPSFSPGDREAYRKATGAEIPSLGADSARGVHYRQIPGFPARRVVGEDHPVLQYYRWFWKEGDGWNPTHSETARGLREKGKFWIWHDPAVRAPSVYGSGGEVDFISQWTYSYPDPLKIELAGNDLLTMAQGSGSASPMNMTQVIWYRSQVAPIPRPGVPPLKNRAPWENEQPEARFVTISPDHLGESLWLKLTEPVKGIMYHGIGSLLMPEEKIEYRPGSYVATTPDTEKRFRQLIETVVIPLGPVIKALPEASRRVAYLQSFTSQMFAGRGTYGWGNGWGADAYLIARYAGLEPKIVYEETIHRDGLEGFNILFLMHCDVLTSPIVAQIQAFQDRGGMIIGDEFLCPAIQPDILLPAYRRKSVADEDKAALMQLARHLHDELHPFFEPRVVSSNPDVLLKQRGENGEYLFVVNDSRTYGDYVGAHRLVMEKGTPASARVTWRRNGSAVYNLSTSKMLNTAETPSGLAFDLDLGPGDGALLVALDKPIGKVLLSGPEKVHRGESGAFEIKVVDAAGGPIPRLLPLKVAIRDARGEEAEQSGAYKADNGVLKLQLDVASNDTAGDWEIVVTEGASGQISRATFQVN